MRMSEMHYRETKYGFQWGEADVSRVISHKGMVVLRVASRATGKFVDIQVSPKGRKMYVSTGEYKSPADVAGGE
jgi:hypothetical protein